MDNLWYVLLNVVNDRFNFGSQIYNSINNFGSNRKSNQ